MVIIQRLSIFPEPAKAGEARSLAEEIVRSSSFTNVRISLSQIIFGEIPTLSASIVHDSLEDVEKLRDTLLSDQSYLDGAAKLNTMVRQPTIIRILAGVVEPVGGVTPNARYSQLAVFPPNNESQDEVRGILEEFSKDQQADGRPLFRMAQILFSHNGPTFILLDSYETLTELENLTQQRAPKVNELRASLSGKLRAPVSQRIQEVIVPFSQ